MYEELGVGAGGGGLGEGGREGGGGAWIQWLEMKKNVSVATHVHIFFVHHFYTCRSMHKRNT